MIHKFVTHFHYHSDLIYMYVPSTTIMATSKHINTIYSGQSCFSMNPSRLPSAPLPHSISVSEFSSRLSRMTDGFLVAEPQLTDFTPLESKCVSCRITSLKCWASSSCFLRLRWLPWSDDSMEEQDGEWQDFTGECSMSDGFVKEAVFLPGLWFGVLVRTGLPWSPRSSGIADTNSALLSPQQSIISPVAVGSIFSSWQTLNRHVASFLSIDSTSNWSWSILDSEESIFSKRLFGDCDCDPNISSLIVSVAISVSCWRSKSFKMRLFCGCGEVESNWGRLSKSSSELEIPDDVTSLLKYKMLQL